MKNSTLSNNDVYKSSLLSNKSKSFCRFYHQVMGYFSFRQFINDELAFNQINSLIQVGSNVQYTQPEQISRYLFIRRKFNRLKLDKLAIIMHKLTWVCFKDDVVQDTLINQIRLIFDYEKEKIGDFNKNQMIILIQALKLLKINQDQGGK